MKQGLIASSDLVVRLSSSTTGVCRFFFCA